jgi:hypothetical protein
MPRSGNRPPQPATAAISSTTELPSAGTAVRQRKEIAADSSVPVKALKKGVAEAREELSVETQQPTMSLTARNQWIVYAIASGACAAFNGVFAKL